MAADGPVSSFPMDAEAAGEEIALLVRKPDFNQLTTRDIVRHMNNRFNINLDSYKTELKDMVLAEIRKRDAENSSESSDSDSDKEEEKKPKGEEKKKKEKKEEVKIETKEASNASDSDSDTGVEDAIPITKRRKRAVADDMVSNVKSSRRAAASNAMKQIRSTSDGARFKSSKTKKEKDPNEDNSGRFGRMTKLCYISPELQTVTGDQFMKRCDVVKSLWDYIKSKNLKDPKAGQYFLCDELLEPIFKKKRVKAFGMAKWLTKHIIGPNDMSPELKEESEREMNKRKTEWLARKREREANLAEGDNGSEEGPSSKKPKTEDEEEGDDEGDDEDKDDGESSNSD